MDFELITSFISYYKNYDKQEYSILFLVSNGVINQISNHKSSTCKAVSPTENILWLTRVAIFIKCVISSADIVDFVTLKAHSPWAAISFKV